MQRIAGDGEDASSYTMHPTIYFLHPLPYTLHSTPCTLHPAPCTLHLTPYTLHPKPQTLNPKPSAPNPQQTFAHNGGGARGEAADAAPLLPPHPPVGRRPTLHLTNLEMQGGHDPLTNVIDRFWHHRGVVIPL